MDKRVHDENSNFQNDNLFVSKITSSTGTAGNSFKVELSDGSLFCVSADFLLLHRLKKGYFVSVDFFNSIYNEDQEHRCYKVALSYVANREHSLFQLKQKLIKKGFEQNVIDSVTTKLVEQTAIDDYRYAIKRLRSRMATKPQGSLTLIGDLINQGVSPSIAKKAVASEFTDTDYQEALKMAYKKLQRGCNKTQQQIVEALIRKGFSYSLISNVIKDLDGVEEI